MSMEFVALALFMAAVTYPSRAIPLLAPAVERLPPPVLEYLRQVGPATLAALAAVGGLIAQRADGASLEIGIEAFAVAVAVGIAAWRRNLLLAIVVAAGLVALARAVGPG